MDEHVLRGNTGILKCHIPSFVADYVIVSAWIEDELTEIYTESEQQFAHGNIGISNASICKIIRFLSCLVTYIRFNSFSVHMPFIVFITTTTFFYHLTIAQNVKTCSGQLQTTFFQSASFKGSCLSFC